MTAQYSHSFKFGASLQADGNTVFRLWAPACGSMSLAQKGQPPLAMQAADDGWFELTVPAPAGTRYKYRMPDGLEVPDPASRLQDGDVHGYSVVLDPKEHEWHNTDWAGRPWHEAVIYELHPGLMGGFVGIGDHLGRLRDLGFTAVELMPVNDFPGDRNWGYDGVLPYAPDTSYGTPGQLKTLIDRAHGLGLLVYLDVVYNHFGPDGAYMHAYAGNRFFNEDKHTPWGAAIAHERQPVRDYFIQNAIYWIMEYRFDGLRFDALHAILDTSFPDDLATAIRAAAEPGRQVHLIMEHEKNRAEHIGPGKMDAQWADDTHHCFHVLLTGETEGYYVDYKDAAPKLARALSQGFVFQGEVNHTGESRGQPSGHLPTTAFIIFLQNHDQIGNRAMGDRLTTLADPEALRAAMALLLLAPQIPMLFMGEEYGTNSPYLFFTDHHDELADAVREGRRREFAGFAAFADEKRRAQIPDPNAVATYELSRPDTGDHDPEIGVDMRVLLGLRHRHIVHRIPGASSLGASPLGKAGVIARWIMGDRSELVIASNFGAQPLAVDAVEGSLLFESRKGDGAQFAQGQLPARSTVAYLLERT